MLFQSEGFLFEFLPITLAALVSLVVLGRLYPSPLWRLAAQILLIACSGYFYAWHNPQHALLLLLLMVINFGLGEWMTARTGAAKSWIFASAVAVNLCVLGWFKYSGFVVHNVNSLLSTTIAFTAPVLPLAISFFTFQKIAYVADKHSGRIGRVHFLDYLLFVVFFPPLIAGPIVHFREIGHQFKSPQWLRDVPKNLLLGVVIFSIGLAKKVVIADTLAQSVDPIFSFAASPEPIDALRAWHAALGYTAQLYFDFSGYSDMAIGLGLMFGIRLPVNFLSPYKATSIIEFWRRWHITLSQFLTDYLYIPLGGNRHGWARRFVNLGVVMLLGGLWHGAQWTFVAWGGLHGGYLIVNHAWRSVRSRVALPASRVETLVGWLVTFTAVVVAWVLFRASDFATAAKIMRAMAGESGLIEFASFSRQAVKGLHGQPEVLLFDTTLALVMIAAALLLAFLAPNTIELARYIGPGEVRASIHGDAKPYDGVLVLQPARWPVALLSGLCLGAALWTIVSGSPTEFIYFRF